MKLHVCPVCDARWLDNQLYWANGRSACPHDLAGLICNVLEKHKNPKCINPCKGSTSGVSWKHSDDDIEEFFDNLQERDDPQQPFRDWLLDN
tara:strand:+ start:274 stop:549 length:276 start_codon:yes stop_codon:yes gene_type:complete